nr:HNH endonuclease signature motif containing protein [Occultella aeris]
MPTADALAAGEIDVAKAELIVAAVEHLCSDQAIEVQGIVLPKARHRPHHQVRQDLARAVAEVDHAHFTQRAQEAAKRRRVDRPRPLGDRMSGLYAVMPTLDAAAVDAALDGAARATRANRDPSTIEQLRADFLGLFGHTALATGTISIQLPAGTDAPIAGASVTNAPPVTNGRPFAAPSGTAVSGPPAPGTAAGPVTPAVPVGVPCTLPPVTLGLVAPFDAAALMADGVVPTARAIARCLAIAERTGSDREVVINALSPAGIEWYRDRDRVREDERRQRARNAPPGPVTPIVGALPGMPVPPPPQAGAPTGAVLSTGTASRTGTAPPAGTASPTGAAPPTGGALRTGAAAAHGTPLPTPHPTPRYQRVDPGLFEGGAYLRGAWLTTPSALGAAATPRSAFGLVLSRSEVDLTSPPASEPEPTQAVPPSGTVLHRYPISSSAGRRARVDVTMPITTLLGGDAPAYVTALGPIPAKDSRAYAAQATLRRLLTDPASGTILDVGTTTYTPPVGLADHVRQRNQICVAPGCSQPAIDSELDHTVPYPAGPTAAHNLGPLCKRHHLLKTHARYRLVQPTPGVFEWTTPTGQRYRKLAGWDTFHLTRAAAPAGADRRDGPPPF